MAVDRISVSRLSDPLLGASITRTASRQTYYTIHFLVDRGFVPDAYRAYGYFRWVDDQLDQGGMGKPARLAFIKRQEALVDHCYHGAPPPRPTREEAMLVDLIRGEREKNSGLQSYIRNLLAVMAFDAGRQGRLISGEELNSYTHYLAVAVTEAMHYFIGHNCRSPHTNIRYQAVTAAHITHMLRDTLEDVSAGYFNIPREYVESHKMDPCDSQSEPYRKWLRSRVALARAYFQSGREYLARVENPRCRLAGFAYTARFISVLDSIKRDDYFLRSKYSESKSLASGLKTSWSLLSQVLSYHRPDSALRVPLGE